MVLVGEGKARKKHLVLARASKAFFGFLGSYGSSSVLFSALLSLETSVCG